ncbi:hypothetical protein [Candidatus Pristimantibacillus sp. PTI5]|uniref:hypothetical protein n=1 Tax=Candidatus Pristimantibacillus sp. PTI5 TaxID=3400422 RepID=UPI003B024B91
MESTSMEKVKAFFGVKNFLNEEQQEQVSVMLGLTPTDLTKRIWGKENEIEFTIMIYLLQWCKNIVGFEEGVAKLTNTVASDLYIELVNGEKIIVEIKSTEKSNFSISESIYLRKKEFAKKMNAKLYFAIKMSGFWTLYSSEYLESKNRKIVLENDFLKSELNEIFGERNFLFPEGLKISSVYSKKSEKHMGIKNSDFGNLVEYKMEYNNNKIIEIHSDKDEEFFLTFLFENLQDVMSNQKQIITEIDSDRTIVIEELTQEITPLSLAGFILSPIRHLLNDFGYVYDFNQYLTNLIDGSKNSIDREHILYAISFLADKDYPILERRGNDIYLFKDMILNKD